MLRISWVREVTFDNDIYCIGWTDGSQRRWNADMRGVHGYWRGTCRPVSDGRVTTERSPMSMLSALLFAPAIAGERPIADGPSIEAALLAVSRDPKLGALIRDQTLRQIAEAGPVALTDGVWVVPIAPGALLADETIGAAVSSELGRDGLMLPDTLDFDLGFAYIPQDAVREFGLDYDFDRYTEIAEDTLASKATDAWWWVVGGGIILGGMAIDYMIDAVADANRNQGYWESRNDFYDTNDPSKDSDKDGKNNRDDDDDDNDGTKDGADSYPFDGSRHICDLCGRTAIVGLGDSTDTIIASDIADSLDLTALLLGSITEIAAPGASELVFQISPN